MQVIVDSSYCNSHLKCSFAHVTSYNRSLSLRVGTTRIHPQPLTYSVRVRCMVMVGVHRSGGWESSKTTPPVTGSTPHPRARRGVGTSPSTDGFAPFGGTSKDVRPRGPGTGERAQGGTHVSMREREEILALRVPRGEVTHAAYATY